MTRLFRLAATALALLLVLAGMLSAYWRAGLGSTLSGLGVTLGPLDIAGPGLVIGAAVGVGMTVVGAASAMLAPRAKVAPVPVAGDTRVGAGRI